MQLEVSFTQELKPFQMQPFKNLPQSVLFVNPTAISHVLMMQLETFVPGIVL